MVAGDDGLVTFSDGGLVLVFGAAVAGATLVPTVTPEGGDYRATLVRPCRVAPRAALQPKRCGTDACERSLLHMKRLNLRHSFALVLLFALIVPILAACGGGTTTPAAPTAAPAAEAPTAAPAEAAGNVLRVAQATWPEQLAPQKSSFTHEIAVESLNYEGLTRYDKDLKTVPAAAESWEYNKDATEITFKLRDGLKYS